MADKQKQNPLAISLTESAVFLRSNGTGRRHHNQSRPSLLRGLVTLDLLKPTRITSVELELTAKTSTAWPDGIGARRIEVTEEHNIFHASTVYFRAEKMDVRRNASIGPGVASSFDELGSYDSEGRHTPISHEDRIGDCASLGPDGATTRHAIGTRRRSADSSYFQRTPLSHKEFPVPPTPPYSPFTTHPPSPSSEGPQSNSAGSGSVAAHNLEDFRNSLYNGSFKQRSRSAGLSQTVSPAASVRSFHQDVTLSRRPSIEDIPENEVSPDTANQISPPPTPPESPASPREHRGRRGAGFSLSSVSNVLMGAVRSSSPKTRNLPQPHNRPGDDEEGHLRRGRSEEKGKAASGPNTSAGQAQHSKEERSAFSKFGDILRLDHDENHGAGDRWKEFKKGTYTYPISYEIPADSPPTLRCSYGSVVWRLRATVHRPGAFKSKYTASREVFMVTCPTEEDTEDTENIIVERHWDQQLQYLISVSGRNFCIGGTVPITLTLMPLAKVKVYRLSVFIEEKVDYYTQMRRVARTDPLTRIELLCLMEGGKTTQPILPLQSDDVNAFENSPLFSIMKPGDDMSEMASSLMGQGPWTFHQDLKLPTSCSMMRATNKNRRSNIIVTHLLKCVMRVERGDDLHVDSRTGKRKLFDVVVQVPIRILSCRCNPEWSSLPRYTESFDGTATVIPMCPCNIRRLADGNLRSDARVHARPSALERNGLRRSSDSITSTAETSPVVSGVMPSLIQDDTISRSNQYERLISGQESELGEAPPAYSASSVIPLRRYH